MIASFVKYLNQSIDHVEEWPVDKFLDYYDSMADLLDAETPEG